jgi:16S rRNA (guanine527-N7)-methyltransferase
MVNRFRELLLSEPNVLTLAEQQLRSLEAHYDVLARWNARLNLTALRSVEEAVRFHYAESLLVAEQLVRLPHWPEVRRICDVGSGAGFPGVGVAVVHGDREVELVESHQRKSVFLRESTASLTNVRVTTARFKELCGPWDLVISRAVAWADIAEHTRLVARHVAYVAGPKDVPAIVRSEGIEWLPPVQLPYGRGSVLMGSVSGAP